MSDCKSCQEAETRPKTHGGYQASCQSCNARMLAHSPAAREALLGYPGELQAAMLKLWPDPEQYRKGRIEVHRWVKLIDAAQT